MKRRSVIRKAVMRTRICDSWVSFIVKTILFW